MTPLPQPAPLVLRGAAHYRMDFCQNPEEAFFVQMTMGNDRAVLATYIAGNLAYRRPDQPSV